MHNCLAILLTILSIAAMAQDTVLLEKWKRYPPPVQDSVTKYNLAEDGEDWTVFTKEGQLFVTKKLNEPPNPLPFNINPQDYQEVIIAPIRPSPIILKVNDGFLISLCHGEWGGALLWFSEDGQDHYVIQNSGTVQFIKRGDSIYAAGMGYEYGVSKGSKLAMTNGNGYQACLYKLKKESNKWKAEEYLKIEGGIEAIALDKANNFIVVNMAGIYEIDCGRRITAIVERRPYPCWWYRLFPNSMVVKNNLVYIGMVEGVLEFDRLTKKQTWLRKN